MIVSFDGISGAGKSTLIKLLYDRSENAEIISGKKYDPLVKTTQSANYIINGLN